MEIKLTFKTPDVLDQIQDQVGADDDVELDKINSTIGRFVEHEEYITIIFDTERRTATVEPFNSV